MKGLHIPFLNYSLFSIGFATKSIQESILSRLTLYANLSLRFKSEILVLTIDLALVLSNGNI